VIYEIEIDVMGCKGKKEISPSGHLYCLSSFLENELKRIGLPVSSFVEIVIDFLSEKTASHSGYTISKVMTKSSRILDLWITTTEGSRRAFLVVSAFNDVTEVTLLEPFYFNQVMQKVLLHGSKLNMYEISMPFLYKFIVFETFDAFGKMSRIRYQGLISKEDYKYMVAVSEDERALVWKVDSTSLNLIGEISGLRDNVLRHLNL